MTSHLFIKYGNLKNRMFSACNIFLFASFELVLGMCGVQIEYHIDSTFLTLKS